MEFHFLNEAFLQYDQEKKKKITSEHKFRSPFEQEVYKQQYLNQPLKLAI